MRRHAFGQDRVATTAQLTTLGMLSKILCIYDMLEHSVCETYRIKELCSQPKPAIVFKRLLDIERTFSMSHVVHLQYGTLKVLIQKLSTRISIRPRHFFAVRAFD